MISVHELALTVPVKATARKKMALGLMSFIVARIRAADLRVDKMVSPHG